ncbi:MAG: putative integral rane protein [Xanthomonadaceae bacterium]|nr:putative integral rane protein [Xanthomonadaceae bacterium]
MKSLLLAASVSLLLSTALLSPTVSAEPGHGGGGRGHSNGHDKNDRGDRGDDRSDRGDGGNHHRYARSHRYAYGHRVHHDNGLHLGQHKFERGQRVPAIYRESRYYVQDYRAYNLAPPPRGYRWVQPDNGRYLLISTATGLISQILGY